MEEVREGVEGGGQKRKETEAVKGGGGRTGSAWQRWRVTSSQRLEKSKTGPQIQLVAPAFFYGHKMVEPEEKIPGPSSIAACQTLGPTQ